MMRTSLRWTLPVLLLALVGGSCSQGRDGDGKDAEEIEADSANLRRAAMNEWYTEKRELAAEDGPWSRDYRQFIVEAAGRERQRWGKYLPSPDARFAPRVSGTTWTNLGPT